MSVFYLITAAIYFFVKSLAYLKLKLSTIILIKYSYNALIFIFYFCLFFINKIIYPCKLNYLVSVFIYFYLIYRIYKEYSLLKYFNITLQDEVTLNYKINLIILKMHILVLKKQNNIIKLFIICFCVLKFKILFNILIFKYFGTFVSVPLIYFQTAFYCGFMQIYYNINRSAIAFDLDLDYLAVIVEDNYIYYKNITFVVLMIYSLELFCLLFY